MQVTVVRRGGLAGVALRGDAETSDLPPPTAAAAEAALGKLAATSEEVAASHPDGFLYELTFDGQSVTLDESQLSDELRPVIDAAMAKATLD
jgi:hypothetical protein